jgi:hypothetical protein
MNKTVGSWRLAVDRKDTKFNRGLPTATALCLFISSVGQPSKRLRAS